MMTLKASGTDWSSTLRKTPVTSSDQWMNGSAVGLDSTESPFVIILVSRGGLFQKASNLKLTCLLICRIAGFFCPLLVSEFFCLPAALFQTTTGTSL